MESEWNKALEKAQRFTSLAFFFAMMTGSAFYDHRVYQYVPAGNGH